MHVRPLFDYASTIWNLGYSFDFKLLEDIQRRWGRAMSGMEDEPILFAGTFAEIRYDITFEDFQGFFGY